MHGSAMPVGALDKSDTLSSAQSVALDALGSLEVRVDELKCRLQGYPPPTPTPPNSTATERARPNGAHESALEIRSTILRLNDKVNEILTRL